MFKNDVATLSQCIQCKLLKIHQYRVQIVYKPGPEIFTADWLLRHNHTEGKDKPIKGRTSRWIPYKLQWICQIVYQWQKYSRHHHWTTICNKLKGIIITGWPDSRDELHVDLQPYWSFRNKLEVIDGIILKGRCIIMPNSLREQVLNQLHTNHMGIEKTKLLAWDVCTGPAKMLISKNT